MAEYFDQNVLIDCHTVNNTLDSFRIESQGRYTKLVRCSRSRTCADKVDLGVNNSFHEFSETSQIAVNETLEQDRKELYDQLLGIPKRARATTIYYLDQVGGNDANSGLTPALAKQTLAGVMAVMGVGDALYIAQGTYDANPNIISCQKCEIFMEPGVEFINTAGTANALDIVGNANIIHANFAVAAAPPGGYWGIGLGGPQNKIYDMITVGGYGGWSVDGDRNELYGCRVDFLEDVSGAIGFRISQNNHILKGCIARCEEDGFVHRNHIGFMIYSNGPGPARRNLLIDCHTMWAGGYSFQVFTNSEDNSFIRCSRMATDGERLDQGTRTSWSEFSNTSRISSGNSKEEDWRDISARIPKKVRACYYIDWDNGNDANSGLTPEDAKKTFAGVQTVMNPGDALYVSLGAYQEDPVQIYVPGIEVFCAPGTLFLGSIGRALEIVAPESIFHGGFARAFSNPGLGVETVFIEGSLITVRDLQVEAGFIGFHVSGDRINLINCQTFQLHDEAGAICFNIAGAGQHQFHNCVARGIAGPSPVNQSKGFVISSAFGPCSTSIFVNCHSLRNALRSFEVEATCEDNLFTRCSKHRSDGDKVDSAARTSWNEFSEASQILTGNSIEEDSKVIVDLLNTKPNAVDIDLQLSGSHGLGSWEGGIPPTPAEIDAELSSSHGPGSWEGGTPAAIADAVWDEPAADHQGLTTFGGLLRILKGTSRFNWVADLIERDTDNNMTSARIRLFDDSATAAAATKDAPGLEGAFLAITLEGEYANRLIDFGKFLEA